MKTSIPLAFNPTFTPGVAGVGTLNFSSYNTAYGFAINRLLAVLDLATGTIIYAVGQGSAMAGTFNAGTNVLTLAANTSVASGYSSGDTLECIYDAPRPEGWPQNFHLVSAANTNATLLKAAPGVLGGAFTCPGSSNPGISQYLKIYDLAALPNVGVSVPKLTISTFSSSVSQVVLPSSGIQFNTGIAIAITAGSADTDASAATANGIVVDVFFA